MRRNNPWNQQGARGGRGPGGRNTGLRGIPNDRGFGDNVPVLGGTGPADQLQLRDLDLELALLKRKRELIEHQQTMLIKDQYGASGSSQYRFDQPREGYGEQFGSMRKLSELYEERGGDRYDRPPSLKRSAHAISPWETSPAPKRPSRPSRPARGALLGQPPPLLGPAPRPRYPPRDRPFRPSSGRVGKSRPSPAPNKLSTYPVAERKKLVEAAAPRAEPAMVFDSTKPTPPKVLGRMELALGNILRELRTEFSGKGHAKLFAEGQAQRALKQAIRDRIRTIMDGRVVGPCSEVIELYRKAHPKKTDLAFLNNIGNPNWRQNKNVTDIIETANPEQYFTANFNKILSKSLTKLFKKMQEVYASDVNQVISEIYDEAISEVQKEVDANESTEGKTAGDENPPFVENSAETSAENDTPITEEGEKVAENVEQSEEEEKKVDEEVAAENEKTAENGEKTEVPESTTEEGEKVAENVEQSEEQEKKVEDELAAENESTAENGEKTEVPESNPQEGEDTPAKNEDIEEDIVDLSDIPNPVITIRAELDAEKVKSKFYNRLVEHLLRRQLPYVLPRFKRNLMNIIRSDKEFMDTKEFLITSTKEKINSENDQEQVGENKEKPARAPIATPDGKPLYVKIVGRPVLPRKKSMKSFLDEFSPILIKKHRNVHNILFVAFDSQENFDNILAKNGQMMGHVKLDIRVSEKNVQIKPTPTEPQEDVNNSQENVNNVSQEAETTSLLDDTLDDQITDLLTTIRQEEEKKLDGGSIDEENILKGDSAENSDAKMDTISEEIEDSVNENQVEENANTNENEVEEKNQIAEENGNAAENKNENSEAPEEKTEELQIEESNEADKKVEEAKNEAVKATPTRASSRIAASTPRTITTRRASRLGQ